ncbi:MAG: hypothetical protein J6Z14_14405 [Prevotella sp.]|nr:hypothetical protein [Prevotella sp.]
MKQSKKFFGMMVATFLMATSVWAGGTVTVIKKLNGEAITASSPGEVSYSVSQADGVCTLTVTPVAGNYIKVANITAERTIEGSQAQSRFKAPGFDNVIAVSAVDATADPSGETQYTFQMPDAAYDVEVVADFQTRTSIANAVVTLAETSYDYDGNPKEPAVSSVVLGTTTLTQSTDYTFEYSDNVNAGTGTVTVTGQGIYNGEATATFTINKAALTGLTVTLEGWTYDAYEDNEPSVSGNLGEGAETFYYKVKDADDNTYTGIMPGDAGTYTVKVEVAETDNYQAGSDTADFIIAKADLELGIEIVGWTYGDEPNVPEVSGNLGEGAMTITYLGENDDEPTATVPTNAGGYQVIVSVAETANYNSAETMREFSIEKADFSQVVVAAIDEQVYTGDPIEPTITVTFNGNPVDASEYEVDYGEDNVDVGTVTVTLTSNEINFFNGDEPVTTTFEIVPAEVEITAENQEVTYNGDAQYFNYSEVDAEVVVLYYASEEARDDENGEQLEVVVDAGTYYVKLVPGDDNHTFAPVYATFTILPKTLAEDMVWIEGGEFVYDGEPQTLEEGWYGVEDWEIGELIEDADFTVSYANNTNVGTATVTFTGVNNYQGTVTRTFDILRELDFIFNESLQWVTYYAEEDLAIPEGMKAYIVTATDEEEVTVQDIDYIPQHVGVLLSYEGDIPDNYLAYAYTGNTNEFADNLLQGNSNGTDVTAITDNVVYVLYNNEFVKSTTGTIPATRAYLLLDDAIYGGPQSRALRIVYGGEYNGIDDIVRTTVTNGQIYNLQGMRLTQPKKGLVIVNGKKMFVK